MICEGYVRVGSEPTSRFWRTMENGGGRGVVFVEQIQPGLRAAAGWLSRAYTSLDCGLEWEGAMTDTAVAGVGNERPNRIRSGEWGKAKRSRTVPG